MFSVPGDVGTGIDDGIGDGDATSMVGIGLAGVLLGDALGAAVPVGTTVAVGVAVGGVEARGLGFAGRMVMPGMGPMLMPGIGAMVDCADGAPNAGETGAIDVKAANAMNVTANPRSVKNLADVFIYYDM